MAEDLRNHIGWGIIGTPDGMECKSGGCIQNFDLRTLLDLDNRLIEIFPGTEILCLFKEIRNSHVVYYYLLYRYAREVRSGRPGSFYGSVLAAVEKFIEAEKALSILYQLSNYLETFLDADKRFRGSLSGILLPEPEGIRELPLYTLPAPEREISKNGACFLPVSGSGEVPGTEFFSTASSILASGACNRVYGSESLVIIQRLRTRNTLPFIYKDTIWQNLKIDAQNQQLQLLERNNQQELSRSKSREEELRKELKKALHTIEQLRHEHAFFLKQSGHKLDQARLENSRLQKKRAQGTVKKTEPFWKNLYISIPEFSAAGKSVAWIGAALLFLVLAYLGYSHLPPGSRAATKPPAKVSYSLPALKGIKEKLKKPDLQLQKLAGMYGEEMKNTANQYQPDTLVALLTRLKEAGMESDSSYFKLNALYHNYGLTGLPLSDLSVEWYTVKKGDYSPALVLKHLKKAYPGKKLPGWFESSFLAINELHAGSRLRTGTKFTVLLPSGK